MVIGQAECFLLIIVIAAASAFIITSTFTPAFAKNFFNYMTDITNEHGKLNIDDVNMCLHREYSVYRNTPYHTHGQGAGW